MIPSFVTYETAKLLKEKGFNEPCLAWYYSDRSALGKLHLEYSEPNTKYHLNAPTYCQVIDWIFIKLLDNSKYIEIIYAGSKPRNQMEEEITEALKLI